ncbi:MAG: ABC transporter permease subunit, partial [Chloroflexota bacterium]
WPGLGYAMINAINTRDYTLVETITVFYVIAFLLLNFAIDLAYNLIDPRTRHA